MVYECPLKYILNVAFVFPGSRAKVSDIIAMRHRCFLTMDIEGTQSSSKYISYCKTEAYQGFLFVICEALLKL